MSSKILTKAGLQVDENGKTHKRKRELPPGLSKRNTKVLRKVKNRAHRLDKGFRICVVRKAKQAEIPDWLLHHMLLNNAFSAGVGLVPFVGDVGVAAFKANSRNGALLEEFLRIRGEEFMKSQKAQGDDDTEGQGKLKGKRMSKEDMEAVKPEQGWPRMRRRTRKTRHNRAYAACF
ncbi:hypothetical protein ACEPAI_6689 [Sanghuangporus weigelae]